MPRGKIHRVFLPITFSTLEDFLGRSSNNEERKRGKGQSNLSREIRKTTLSKKGHVTNTESLELSNLLLFSLSVVVCNTGLV